MPQLRSSMMTRAARVATASSTVTIPRSWARRVPGTVSDMTRSASDHHAAEGVDQLQDERQQGVLHGPVRDHRDQHPGDADGGDDADRPLRADHPPLVPARDVVTPAVLFRALVLFRPVELFRAVDLFRAGDLVDLRELRG